MTADDDRAGFRAIDVGPGVAFVTLYLLTLSRTLSITHDSALFLRPIESLHPTFHPNHLWFEPIMATAYQLMMLIWPHIGAQMAVEAVNALAGASALQAAYAIARWRVGLERSRAALAVACAGFTYGVWYYSIAIEAYALPLALTSWAYFGLSAPATRWRVVILCAIAHALAILCHQSAVLFGVVAVGAMVSTSHPWRRRTAQALAYLLIVAALVGGAYVAAAIDTGHGQRVGQAARWSVGFLSRRIYWQRPPRAFVYAAMGATRAVVGGQFTYAIPEMSRMVDRWLPSKDPVEERFFVRTVTPQQAWLYSWFALLALVSLCVLLAMAARALPEAGFSAVRRGTALLAIWLAVYCAFFTFWDSANPDFWVVQVFLTPLLVAAILASTPASRLQTGLFGVLAFSLFVVNGVGTVRLARDPANDYYPVYLRSVARELRPGDVLVVGDHWPIRTHLDRHSIETLYLSVEIWRTTPVALAVHLQSRMASGSRVFVAPDIMEVPRATQLSLGPRYVQYAGELRGRFYGLGHAIGGPDEMPLREVTCVDGTAVPGTSGSRTTK